MDSAKEGSIKRTLCEALGGSVIAEELKGDFAKADEIAQQFIAATKSLKGHRAIDARLDLALIQILQGSPSSELEILGHFTETEALTPNQLARRLVLRNLDVHVRFIHSPEEKVTLQEWMQFGEKRVPDLYLEIKECKLHLAERDIEAGPGFLTQVARNAQNPLLFDFHRRQTVSF